ncbi:MAG: hypothetical protein WBN78_11165, partial [Gammaproteobacteria bacterium]
NQHQADKDHDLAHQVRASIRSRMVLPDRVKMQQQAAPVDPFPVNINNRTFCCTEEFEAWPTAASPDSRKCHKRSGRASARAW